MTFAVVVQPQAEADLAAAFDWYQQRQPGHGFERLDEAEASICKRRTNPIAISPDIGTPEGCGCAASLTS